MNTPFQRKAGWHRQREGGVAIVEFALASILFFTILFAIIDFSYLLFANLTMQHAVREGARYAVTGQSALDPQPQGTAQDRCDAAVQRIRNQSMGFFDRMAPTVVFKTVNADGSISVTPGNSCANANQIIVISVQCNLPLLTSFLQPFFANGKYSFTAGATMKNEAFK
jgi:Flp pilus assembly protein TadG